MVPIDNRRRGVNDDVVSELRCAASGGVLSISGTAAIGVSWAFFGAQEVLYAGTDKKPDVLPLVYAFFPDFMTP